MEELRAMLKSVKWSDFIIDKYSQPKEINGVTFTAAFGQFLGRPTLAVIVDGEFVATRICSFTTYHDCPLLDPACIEYKNRFRNRDKDEFDKFLTRNRMPLTVLGDEDA